MPTLDWSDVTPLALDEPLQLTERERAAAIETWRGRMVNEHVSARVFSALVPQAMKAGLAPRRQQALAAMATEELRHGELCASVVRALGGEACADLPDLPDVPEHDAPPLEALLRNVLSVSCLSETVAVALVDAERLKTGPAPLARVLREILADEVGHARFGWTLVEECAPALDAAARDRLGAWLVGAFTHLRTYELSHLPPVAAPSEHAESVGVCDGNEARELFFATVETVIVPGLERLRLPARVAWKASFVREARAA